jgi:hypothetical protein
MRLQEEGIVVKALDSQWRVNDRSNSWVKLKPDYVNQVGWAPCLPPACSVSSVHV